MTPIRTITVARVNDKQVRAAFPLDERRSLYGYGPTIPAALSGLARAIERWGMAQVEELLQEMTHDLLPEVSDGKGSR
jgi:hypothetical protein